MKKLISTIIIAALVAFHIAPATASAAEQSIWPEGPKVHAKAAIVMDASTGLILYEKNIHDKNYPASTTKLMTTLLALENTSMNDVVHFSKNAIFGIERGSSHIGIDVGEELTMENCLYAIMLASANEVSYAVAEHISGSMDEFAKKMNERAKELGATNTHFINSHGLFDENHYTSAYDLALIAKELLKYESFRKITSTINYVVPPTNLQPEARPISNHHKMIRLTNYHYDGIIGGKTGYTVKAKYNLATFASRDGMDLICIVMNDDTSPDQYADTKALLDFGFSKYKSYPITESKDVAPSDDYTLFTQFNSLFNKEDSPIRICNDGVVVLPKSVDPNQTTKTITYNPDVKLTTGVNTIGKIIYTFDGKEVGYADILYDNSSSLQLKKANFIFEDGITLKDKITTNKAGLTFLVVLLLIGAIGGTHFILVERPRRKRRKSYYERRRRTKETFDHDFMDLF